MKTQTLLLSLLALSAWTASAQVDIPLLNTTFDLDQLQCSPSGNCATYGISGWLSGPETSLLKASSSQFKGVNAEGLYVAALGNTSGTGSILQTLGDTLQANTTYILKVKIGARSDYPFTGYSAGLVAGNVTVASGDSATPVGGAFVIEEITYNSGATPAQLGKPLQVFVKSLGTGQADVAAVILTATPD
ncbi:hypothetical protein [Nevskia soli]|jgi:hypothetical protein|uniref:hypothetical protein n=1 Tax=Nevskia soli TaxID=418856 RepID=UPI0015D8BB38|nr:hypothetical protein [Nevskia soli]